MPNGRSFGDRRDSAAESERVLAASIYGSYAAVRHPDDDRFWLVVISVACASHRTRHIVRQSCGMLSAVDNTKDMERAVIEVLNQSIALCNWLPLLRCYYTSTDGLCGHLPSRSCNGTTYIEHTSFLKSCQSHSLCNLAQKHTSLSGSILPDKTLDNIWNNDFYQRNCEWKNQSVDLPTP